MNFLAHLKLSGDHESIMLGNFIADHIRGNKIHHLPQEVIDGIMLHRKIDYYTDHHPEFMKTRARLHKKYHKYAGVIADIFYDHFLAKNWSEYSEFHLSSFTSYSYGILLRNYSLLPSQTKKILPFFIMQNWLASYAKMEGLRRSFQYMARKANFKSNMEYVVDDLIDDYELYEAEFKTFFPDIAAYCQNELDILFPSDKMSKKNQIISEKATKYNTEQKEIKERKKKIDEAKKKKEQEEKTPYSFRDSLKRKLHQLNNERKALSTDKIKAKLMERFEGESERIEDRGKGERKEEEGERKEEKGKGKGKRREDERLKAKGKSVKEKEIEAKVEVEVKTKKKATSKVKTKRTLLKKYNMLNFW